MYSRNTSFNSGLLDIPPNADAKQVAILVQQNLDIIWRVLNDNKRAIETLNVTLTKLQTLVNNLGG